MHFAAMALGSIAVLLGACGGMIDESEGHDAGAADDPATQLGEPDADSGTDAGPSDEVDASLPPLDAALGSIPPASAGVAGFALVINHVVQAPANCVGLDWEFAPYPAYVAGGWPDSGAPPGVTSVLLVNTGALPMPYITVQSWEYDGHFQPGVPTSLAADALTGVLEPGAVLDITSSYRGAVVALLGSIEPFSAPEPWATYDESTIPWPQGVAGGGGATMHVAEIEVPYTSMAFACERLFQVW